MRRSWVVAVAVGLQLLMAHHADAQYWIIGDDETRVWSLGINDFVPINDSGYVAWLASLGHRPSKIASAAELYDVIAELHPARLPASAQALEDNGGLSPTQAFLRRRAAGLTITYAGASSLDGRYPIDDQWLGGLMTAALLRCGATALDSCSTAFPAGSSSYTYLDIDFVPHTMTIVQMRTIVLAIENYVAMLYTQLQAGLGGGTPSWPSSSVTIP